eukprot:Gb_07055 [translate_table: standard]
MALQVGVPENISGSLMSSRSVTETINGSHNFVIQGYSLAKGMGVGRHITSETFTVRVYKWAIAPIVKMQKTILFEAVKLLEFMVNIAHRLFATELSGIANMSVAGWTPIYMCFGGAKRIGYFATSSYVDAEKRFLDTQCKELFPQMQPMPLL